MNRKHLQGYLALSPILVFLAVYLVSSLLVGDFYKIPISAAFLMAASLCGITSTSIIPYLYYPFALGLCAIIGILL